MLGQTTGRFALDGKVGVTPSADSRSTSFDRLTAREGRLWLLALILLVALSVGLALVSWQPLRSLPWTLDALPVGLVLLVYTRIRAVLPARHCLPPLAYSPGRR